MTTIEALRARCKLICNTCYVDDDVLQHVIETQGLENLADPNEDIKGLTKAAILVVKGWVETNRGENGISSSADVARINRSIAFWCEQVGLNAIEYITDEIVIDDGTALW